MREDRLQQMSSTSATVAWVASALAACGAAVIAFAGDGHRPIVLGLVLLGISLAASLISARRTSGATTHTYAAGLACGALSAAVIAGLPSFGLALLPATVAWGVVLGTADHPADGVRAGMAGVTTGVGLGAVALVTVSLT